MGDADDVVHVAEGELEELVREDAGSICEAEEGVVRKDCAKAHCPRVQDCFVAETA